MNLAELIRSIRAKSGLSQKDFSLKIGTSQAAVNYWESGKRRPRIDQLEKIAEAFNVDLWMLPSTAALNKDEQELTDIYRSLNSEGQNKVVDYTRILSRLPEYRK